MADIIPNDATPGIQADLTASGGDCIPACAPNTAVGIPGQLPPVGGSPGATGIEIGFAPVGCTFDANGVQTGTVFTAETRSDTAGSPSTYRMVHVSTTGVVTDPFVGTWADCTRELLPPQQFCFTSSSTGPVVHPGRMYDITLPLNPGFAVESLQIDSVNHPANITWGITDTDGSVFAAALDTFITSRLTGSTVTITNPNAGTIACGVGLPMQVHIECLRIDTGAPDLVELVYNAGRDLIVNPAFTTDPVGAASGQLQYMRRADEVSGVSTAVVACTGVANRGWETNDVNKTFETWGPISSAQNVGAGTTPTPRGTIVQEINAFGSGNAPNTIWQTFNAPAGMLKVAVTVGGRQGTDAIPIKFSTGDVGATGPGDIINTIVNAPQVTTEAFGTAGPWTTYTNTLSLPAGIYTLAFTGPTNSGTNAFGGLFTDMRVYVDSPGVRATAVNDDATCTVTTTETSTTTTCSFWMPQVASGQIVSWTNVATGAVMTNAAFWAQVPAPTCCRPDDATAGDDASSADLGNLSHSYTVCGTVGGIEQPLQRYVITDQSGGIIAATFIGIDGAPVNPTAWHPGLCEGATGTEIDQYETHGVPVCFNTGPNDTTTWYTYERVRFNNSTQVEVSRIRHWTDGSQDVTVQPAGTIVDCDLIAVTSTAEPGCADGVPYTRMRFVYTVTNDAQQLGVAVGYFNSAGVEQAAAPANFRLGACPPVAQAEFDQTILCAPDDTRVVVVVAYSATGVPTTTGYTLAGAIYAGDLNLLTNCGSAVIEADPVVGCANDIDYVQWIVKEDGVPTGSVYYTDNTGAVVATPANWSAGACITTQRRVIQSTEAGCANDVPWTRLVTTFYDANNGGIVAGPATSYRNSAGVEQAAAPAGFTLGLCAGTDIEIFTEYGCAAGVPYTRVSKVIYDLATGSNVGLPEIIYIDSLENAIAVQPSGFLLGPCPGAAAAVQNDIESISEPGCAAGVPWTRITRTRYNPATDAVVGAPVVIFTNSAGAVTSASPVGFTLGACPPNDIEIFTEYGCADGVPWNRVTRLRYNVLDGTVVGTQEIAYIDSAGNDIAVPPSNFRLGPCASCCPVTLGEVCHTGGRAFAIYSPTANTVEYRDVVTGAVVPPTNVIVCADDAALTQINGVIGRQSVTAAGNVAAGKWSVTVLNVGSTDGAVLGIPISPGESVTYTGYFDEFTRQMKRLPVIAYTASATAILRITTQD